MLGHAAEARGYPHPLRRLGRASRRVEAVTRPGRAALADEAVELSTSILSRLDMRSWAPRLGEQEWCTEEHERLTYCIARLGRGKRGLVRLSPQLRLGETIVRTMNPPLEPLRPDVLKLSGAMLLGSAPLTELSSFGNSAMVVVAVRGVNLSRLSGVTFSARDDQLVRDTAAAIARSGESPECALRLARELARDSAATREITLVLLSDGMPVGESIRAARALSG